MVHKTAMRLAIGGLFVAGMLASTLAQMPNPYGAPISLENAKKAAAPALAEAEKNHWNMAVAIVDGSGNLVYYEKMDNTQLGSANVAIDKARSAALFKRPTKALQDALAAGGDGWRILRVQGAVHLRPPPGHPGELWSEELWERLAFLAPPVHRMRSAPKPAPTPSSSVAAAALTLCCDLCR